MPETDIVELDRALAALDRLDGPTTTDSPPERAGDRGPAGRDGGAEASGSVWVSVDSRGRLASADISSTWRQRLEPARFADALFEAYTNALRRALSAELSTRRARPQEPPSEPLVIGDDSYRNAEEWLATVRATLSRIDTRLRTAAAADLEHRDSEIRSPNGYLTLRLRNGDVAGITGNAAGIKSANPTVLGQDVLDMFRHANLAAEH